MTPKEMELWTKQVEAEKKYKTLLAEHNELVQSFSIQHLELNKMCETVEALSEMAGLRQKNRAEILKKLQDMQMHGDLEMVHIEADRLLLDLIDDAEISAAFNDLEKWYA